MPRERPGGSEQLTRDVRQALDAVDEHLDLSARAHARTKILDQFTRAAIWWGRALELLEQLRTQDPDAYDGFYETLDGWRAELAKQQAAIVRLLG